MSATLSHWLRLLWGQSPALHLDSEAPFIAGGAIHLPACRHWRQQRAAAAHAAAHLVFSPTLSARSWVNSEATSSATAPRRAMAPAATGVGDPLNADAVPDAGGSVGRGFDARGFDVRGLGPIARALLGLLEDARVETLACRELPGLARLWRPLHTATPQDGQGFEALMRRLARALADPLYDDPHPWVRKGVGLFFLDADLRLLALRTPAELRVAALRLGHDIGQQRLPFNAPTYRPAPDYRDDHRWMWPADDLAAADLMPLDPPRVDPPPFETPPETPPEPLTLQWEGDPADEAGAIVTHHPEWDRLIARLRPAWCRVIEHTVRPEAPASTPSVSAAASQSSPLPSFAARPGAADDSSGRDASLQPRLRSALGALVRPGAASAWQPEGEVFDLDALLQLAVARRLRRGAEPRIYRAPARRAARASVQVLVDQSASSAAAWDWPEPMTADSPPRGDASAPSGASMTVLAGAARAAQAVAQALQRLGVDCSVAGFHSKGRQAVHVVTVKRPQDAADAALAARLHAWRAQGSTRLGAALRHATAACAHQSARRGATRWVLLLSDGEAHDIDVHDPRYLVEDARMAVRAAARQSVRIACLAMSPPDLAAAQRVFGRRGVQALASLDRLPASLRRLLR